MSWRQGGWAQSGCLFPLHEVVRRRQDEAQGFWPGGSSSRAEAICPVPRAFSLAQDAATSSSRAVEAADETCVRSRSDGLGPIQDACRHAPQVRMSAGPGPTKGARIRLERVAEWNKGLFSAPRTRQSSLHIHFILLGLMNEESQRLVRGDRSS